MTEFKESDYIDDVAVGQLLKGLGITWVVLRGKDVPEAYWEAHSFAWTLPARAPQDIERTYRHGGMSRMTAKWIESPKIGTHSNSLCMIPYDWYSQETENEWGEIAP